MRKGRTIARLAAILGAVALFLAIATPASADYVETIDWNSTSDPCLGSRWKPDPVPDLPFVASGPGTGSPLGSPTISGTSVYGAYVVPPGGTVTVRIDALDCDTSPVGSPLHNAGVDFVEYWVEGADGPRYNKYKRLPGLKMGSGGACSAIGDPSSCRGLRVFIDITKPGSTYIRYRIVDMEGNVAWQPTITVNVVHFSLLPLVR